MTRKLGRKKLFLLSFDCTHVNISVRGCEGYDAGTVFRSGKFPCANCAGGWWVRDSGMAYQDDLQ